MDFYKCPNAQFLSSMKYELPIDFQFLLLVHNNVVLPNYIKQTYGNIIQMNWKNIWKRSETIAWKPNGRQNVKKKPWVNLSVISNTLGPYSFLNDKMYNKKSFSQNLVKPKIICLFNLLSAFIKTFNNVIMVLCCIPLIPNTFY
jgi:hypothetical protein